jgi:hypothetical protein
MHTCAEYSRKECATTLVPTTLFNWKKKKKKKNIQWTLRATESMEYLKICRGDEKNSLTLNIFSVVCVNAYSAGV